MSETHRVRLVITNYGIGFYKNKTATISDRRFSKISEMTKLACGVVARFSSATYRSLKCCNFFAHVFP